MVSIKPYLSVNNALEAIDFYNKIFDAGALTRMGVEKDHAAEFGIPDGTDLSKMTMHASISIGEAIILMSDNFTGDVLEKSNTSILIEPDSLAQTKEFYNNAEKHGCKISMKLEKQFWGDYFASFKDPFGINWQLNFSPPQD